MKNITLCPSPPPLLLKKRKNSGKIKKKFRINKEKYGKMQKILEKIPSISLTLDEILKRLQKNLKKHDVKNYVDIWNIPPSLL